MARRKTNKELIAEYAIRPYKLKAEACYRYHFYDADGKRWSRRTPYRTKAEALAHAVDVLRKLDEGQFMGKVLWADFCRRYELQHVQKTSVGNAQSWHTTREWIGKYWNPKWLHEAADLQKIQEWQLRLEHDQKLAEASVDCYSGRLRAALGWAVKHGLLPSAPEVERAKPRSRGGAITVDELEALCKVARDVRPRDYRPIQRFMRGLFWSGFRLDELRTLSWDRDAKRRLDASSHPPCVWFSRLGQKSREPRVRYILREFWDLCAESTVRTGYVFSLPNGRGGQMAPKTIGRIIQKIGAKAELVTDPDTSKTCTAHDLRKSCSAVLHSKGYSLDETALYLGHETSKTTQTHYPPTSAAALAAKEWRKEV